MPETFLADEHTGSATNHDLEESTVDSILEGEQLEVYLLECQCSQCNVIVQAIRYFGDPPESKEQREYAILQLYEYYRQNPRKINHVYLRPFVPKITPRTTEMWKLIYSDAVSLGRNDANDRELNRSKEEVLRHVLPSSWDGSVGRTD